MDSAEVEEFPDNVTNEQLDDYAWQGALNNAEMYGIYPMEFRSDDYDEEDDGGDEYSDNIEGYWEEYDPEKHDGSF